MSFVFMVFHWPVPGQQETLADSMREMRELLLGTPGCVGVEPPYVTEDGSCLVGISKWESKDAFLASGIKLRPSDEIVEGSRHLPHRRHHGEDPPAGDQEALHPW